MRALMISYTDIGSSKNMTYSFEEKKKGLELFLNDLLKIEEIKNSLELREFLNLTEKIPIK